MPVLLAILWYLWANKTGFNLITFYFNICGKLSKTRHDNAVPVFIICLSIRIFFASYEMSPLGVGFGMRGHSLAFYLSFSGRLQRIQNLLSTYTGKYYSHHTCRYL